MRLANNLCRCGLYFDEHGRCHHCDVLTEDHIEKRCGYCAHVRHFCPVCWGWFGDINLEARHERECWDKNGATL